MIRELGLSVVSVESWSSDIEQLTTWGNGTRQLGYIRITPHPTIKSSPEIFEAWVAYRLSCLVESYVVLCYHHLLSLPSPGQ